MPMGTADAAQRIGVSERRVRQLIATGRLPAERVGRQWVLDEVDVAVLEPGLGRPLSARSTQALIDILSGDQPTGLSPKEQARQRARVQRLHSAEDPAVLLRSWLAGRDRLLRSVPSADLPDLRGSGAVLLSGVSDPRSGFAATDLVEGYVARRHLADLEAQWLLVAADEKDCNVILHVVAALPERLGVGHLLADLAEHRGPREDRQVRVLLSELP